MKKKFAPVFWNFISYLNPFASIGWAVGWLMLALVVLVIITWFILMIDPSTIKITFQLRNATFANFGAGLFLFLGFVAVCISIWRYSKTQVGATMEEQVAEISSRVDQILSTVSEIKDRIEWKE